MAEESLKLFFSYSHKDESLRDELAKHLTILEWQRVISSWHFRKILPGEEWDYQINDNLDTADIILLLVSSDFLFSKYCWDVEVKKAIERHNQGEAYVIPVILRPVDWTDAPFAKLQALPKNAEPVVSRHWHSQDEAFTDVAKGIRAAVEKLKQEREKRQQLLQRQQEQEAERLRQQQEAEQQQAYANNLRLYEQGFSKAVKAEYPISEYVRNGLKVYQMQLGLRDEDVTRIEKSILDPIEEAERIRKQQEAEKLQRQREQEAERIRKQQEAERLKRQQEQEAERIRQQQEQKETDDLSSEKGVDYRWLRDLLKAGEWKQADQETLQVVLKVAGREKEGWLDIDSIKQFPCTDLRTIDQLWILYSKGLFGFSVQKRIYESVGKDYGKFGDRVGWRTGMFFNKEWLLYDQLTFSLNAPQGHLPTFRVRFFVDGVWWVGGVCGIYSLASRLVNCNI